MGTQGGRSLSQVQKNGYWVGIVGTPLCVVLALLAHSNGWRVPHRHGSLPGELYGWIAVAGCALVLITTLWDRHALDRATRGPRVLWAGTATGSLSSLSPGHTDWRSLLGMTDLTVRVVPGGIVFRPKYGSSNSTTVTIPVAALRDVTLDPADPPLSHARLVITTSGTNTQLWMISDTAGLAEALTTIGAPHSVRT